ncbi:MAG: TonB family protein [Proteobacteria bacterium]|nr:TonB family protein [Pseudomonadota bacterium]
MACVREGHVKRWSAAWILAIALHAAIVGVIAWHLLPDHRISVSGMVPQPNATVELMPASAIEAALFFASKPEHLNPNGARLYRLEEDGSRTLISTARLHSKRKYAIQFEAVSLPGEYEIVVDDGVEGIVAEPDMFDGEFSGKFPSGDGQSGGVFRARFKVAQKVEEVMTARLYDPEKPLENEEPVARSLEQPKEEPAREKEAPPPLPVNKKQRPVKPSPAPKNETVAENVAPVESSPEPEENEPSPVPLTPESLRVSPFNLAPELLVESAQTAEKLFAERDLNQLVWGAKVSKQRHDIAYNPEGPVIGIGRQGNSVSHTKEVAEYLALMHKNIHELWAHNYLIRLDTIYRQPGSRINDPDLEAVMEITLDSLGSVTDVRVVRSSGITDYDNEAIFVSWNSSPKLPIPDEMRSPDGKAYIHWTYWRDQRQCGVFGVKVFINSPTSREQLEFSLKKVQLQEKKLGMKPSSISLPGLDTVRTEKKTVENGGSAPVETTTTEFERINPLDD